MCQLCGHTGHIAVKCYHRFDISFHGNGDQSLSHCDGPHAHVATTSAQAHLASASTIHGPRWYMDSGASAHITSDAQNLPTCTTYKGKEKVTIGNGTQLSISHVGSALVNSYNSYKLLNLNHILHVPAITKNLISISQFTRDNNVLIEFSSNGCLVKDKSTKTLLQEGALKNGLYQLDLSFFPMSCFTIPNCANFFVYLCPDNVQSAMPCNDVFSACMLVTNNNAYGTNT